MIGQSWDLLLVVGGPAAPWIGPEMLVDLMIEGRNINALVDSGSQVNTIMPTFVWQCGFPDVDYSAIVQVPMTKGSLRPNLDSLGTMRNTTSSSYLAISLTCMCSITNRVDLCIFCLTLQGSMGG